MENKSVGSFPDNHVTQKQLSPTDSETLLNTSEMRRLEIVVDITPAVPAITSENKCSFCVPSRCCTYVTHQIDTPRTIREFDALLWQLAHQTVQVFKEDGGWYLLINQTCQHLQTDGGCGIYETRPMICREHTNDFCEYDSAAEEGFDLYFSSYAQLDDYCRKRFKKWDNRFDNPKL